MRPIAPIATFMLGSLAFAGIASPVAAKVAEVSSQGFVIRHLIEVPADADATWAMLITPSKWWESAHTWSGDAANLSLDAKAGGCFCEVLPNESSPKAAPRGSVEHMRVIYVEKPRALRMAGALGPLQADAANGTLTFQLKPAASGKGTQVLMEYVVGGYLRTPADKLAPMVDEVLAAQVQSLSQKLGGAFAAAFPAPDIGQPQDGSTPPPLTADPLLADPLPVGPLPEASPKPDADGYVGR